MRCCRQSSTLTATNAAIYFSGCVMTDRAVPAPAFNIKHISVSGPPWDTTIVVEWRDTATLPGGAPYVNDGAH